MSFFAAACAAAFVSHDAAIGEPVQIVPQVEDDTSDYIERGADPTDQPYTIVGIFNEDPIIDTVKGSGANTHENVDVLTSRTSVDFDQSLFTTYPMPVEDWIIVATAQPRQPRFKISTVEPDGVSRVVCKLSFLDYSA